MWWSTLVHDLSGITFSRACIDDFNIRFVFRTLCCVVYRFQMFILSGTYFYGFDLPLRIRWKCCVIKYLIISCFVSVIQMNVYLPSVSLIFVASCCKNWSQDTWWFPRHSSHLLALYIPVLQLDHNSHSKFHFFMFTFFMKQLLSDTSFIISSWPENWKFRSMKREPHISFTYRSSFVPFVSAVPRLSIT
jgi:hypothetical protein